MKKNYYGSLYQALAAGYEKFSSDDVLEAVCKYIMKGEPRRPVYFKWFSLAVSRGLRITRLFEYYVETMDITYRRQLPKPLLMYFAYNDNSLGDARKAYVYASVIAFKEKIRKHMKIIRIIWNGLPIANSEKDRWMKIMRSCIRNSCLIR